MMRAAGVKLDDALSNRVYSAMFQGFLRRQVGGNIQALNDLRAVREFFDREIVPDAEAEEEGGREPTAEVFLKLGQAGIFASRIGGIAMPFVKKLGIKLPGGLDPEKFDYFHELICH